MGPKMDRLSIGDRVKHIAYTSNSDVAGTIESLGTELGPDYASVRFDNNTGFCAQVAKENLVKIS